MNWSVKKAFWIWFVSVLFFALMGVWYMVGVLTVGVVGLFLVLQ